MPHRHAYILLGFIILGAVAGILSGWIWGERMVAVEWMGRLFLDALKMLILPLLLAAVVSGVAALGDVRKLGRVGGATVAWYALSTGLAVLIGLIMVNLIQPGVGIAPPEGAASPDLMEKASMGAADILLSLVAPNLVAAAADMNLLPLILFAIVLAAALTTIGDMGKPLLDFFSSLNEAMMKLVIWLMYLAPVGIFGLIAARLGKAGGGDALLAEIHAVGLHVATVLSGLAVHSLVLVLCLVLIGRRGLGFILEMGRALVTAFGTSSSTATVPLTMECAREAGVDERAVRFVIPLGSTINMNGTALYEAAAAMFIAQAYGVDLGIGAQAIIFLTATLAAIGAAGIPEAGLVTMVIVLNAVGLPIEGIGLLLAVDWFLDRFRTVVNVWGDAVGATIIHRILPDLTGEDDPEPEAAGAIRETRP